MVLQLAYVGSRGLRLFRQLAVNQAPIASAEHPMKNPVTGEVITANTPGNALLRAPFQGTDTSFLDLNQTSAQVAGRTCFLKSGHNSTCRGGGHKRRAGHCALDSYLLAQRPLPTPAEMVCVTPADVRTELRTGGGVMCATSAIRSGLMRT
jgi:hypothetical protein